jgi:hypothetical protein
MEAQMSISLIPYTPSTPQQRAFLAAEQLKAAMDELYELVKSDPVALTPFIRALEEVEIRMSLLRPRVKLSKSLIHLCSEMGRPAP